MIIATFPVPGIPVAKARARVTKAGHAFTPKKTQNYEALVKMCAAQAMKGKSPVDGPVVVQVIAVFPQAESWPMWKKRLADLSELAHTKKPDEDNIGKAISDAMNGVVYIDDAQVTIKTIFKKYVSIVNREVGCFVSVYKAPGHPCQIKMRPE